MNKNREHDVYTEYYLNQAGCGFSNIYSGPIYQKGYGIGSFLGGLFRCAFPILKKTSAAVGNEFLKSGCNVISDISRNEDPKVAIKKRGKETIDNLSKLVGEKIFGSGYNTTARKRKVHSVARAPPVKKHKPSKKNNSVQKRKPSQKRKPPQKRKPAQKREPKKKQPQKERTKYQFADIFS